MKYIILLGMIVLLLIVGCNPLQPQPYEPTKHLDDSNVLPLEGSRNKYAECTYPYYLIYEVEKINTEYCFTLKEIKKDYMIGDSLRKGIRIPSTMSEFTFSEEQYLQDNFFTYDCEHITIRGKMYCLKDNSTCLMINNNICEVYSE